jgi:hypothetical protein
MTKQTNPDSNLVRVFKKINQTVHDITRVKRKAIVYVDVQKPPQAGNQPKPAPLPVKTRTVTVQGKPRKPLNQIMKEAKETIKKAKAYLAEDVEHETGTDSLKKRGVEHPQNDPNKNPVVYYIKAGNYYLMYHDKKVHAFMQSNSYWVWVTQHKQDDLGNFEHCTDEHFQDIIENKYDQSALRLAYHVYRPTDWDFKTDEEREAYKKLNKYVDYQTATKV